VPRHPLLPAPWRSAALLVWVLAAIALTILSIHVAHPASGHLDRPLSGELQRRLAEHDRLLSLAVHLGTPEFVAGASIGLAVLCVVLRRPYAAVFALVAAPAAGAMTEYVLKPLVDRRGVASLLFPSGHTTGAFAVALTVAVLLLPRADAGLLDAAARLLVGVLALAAAAVVAVGVVALGWHYVTDAMGGVVTAVIVVLAVAAAVDAIAARGPWDRWPPHRWPWEDARATRPAGSPPRA
jgi:membrane-associated phospholipid phosphatase